MTNFTRLLLVSALTSACALAASADPITQPETGVYYNIVNASGDYLTWDGSKLRALSQDDNAYQAVTFTEVQADEGYYNIWFLGQEDCLAGDGSNGWTAVLSSNPNSDLSKYMLIVSEYDGDYVNIKSKGVTRGGGMLGLDSGDTTVYTDKSDGNLAIWQLVPATVELANVESVTLSATEANLTIFASTQLTATVVADSDRYRLSWSTSDANVARVSTSGLVRAYAGGTAVITATCGDVTATCTVTVDGTDKYPDKELADDDPRKNAYEGYKLVFAEEFSTDGNVSTSVWGFEEGYKRNNEDQYYVNPNSTLGKKLNYQNAYVKDGVMAIIARKESPSISYSGESIKYTSASVISNGGWNSGYSWLFGIFEIRAKITAETGLWPAIWSTGREEEWPQGGEIDIMEYYGDGLHANVCWGNGVRWGGSWNSAYYSMSNLPSDWDQDFHTWKMVWDYDTMQLWVDDILLNEIDLDTTVNVNPNADWYSKDGLNPFRQIRQICWLNLALGGNNGGSLSKTTFPSYYLIDYVRVYQKVGSDGKATYHVDEEVSEPCWSGPNPDRDEESDDDTDGIATITAAAGLEAVEVYDLSGRCVNAEAQQLKGLYIVKQGSTVEKVVF